MNQEIIKQDDNIIEIKREPEQQQKEFLNEFNINSMLASAGTIELTDKQKSILYAPIDRDKIAIRPDGMIYLPWVFYAERLHEAFGMEWALIPQGMPKIQNNYIMWGFYLVIKGKLAAFAIGGQLYYANNNKMSYDDACEGAKSNAAMRCCKDRGIAKELWQPEFIAEWKAEYAEQYITTEKGKQVTRWRKKGNDVERKEIIQNIKNIVDNIKLEPNEMRDYFYAWIKKDILRVYVNNITITDLMKIKMELNTLQKNYNSGEVNNGKI